MNKVGVIGDKDTVLIFKAAGLEVFPVNSSLEGKTIIDKLAREKYAVLFVTEQIAYEIEETIDRYKREVVPAIILIPNNGGTLNLGLKSVEDNVEKAVGINIL